jgi:drug/metabolite transporter (DMT)-like permease
MKRAHLLLLIVFNVFWAGILSVNKELEHHLTFSSIVTLRFALAAIPFALVWPWLPGPAPRGWNLLRSAVMGVVVFALGQRLQVYGNLLGTAGNSSILMGFEPILTSIAAALFLRERITKHSWLGFLLCLGGLALLNRVWAPDFRWTGLLASLIFISSFLCETAYSIIGKPLGATASPYKVVGVSLFAATLLNLVLEGSRAIPAAMQLPAVAWAQLLYMGLLCTSAGYVLWLLIIRETPVNLVALTIFIQPLAGVLIARFWLGEPLHWGHLWGGLSIAAGLAIGFIRPAAADPVPARGLGSADQ